MGDSIEIHAKPTTGEIARARLHLFFGSRYARLMLVASPVYVGLSWVQAGRFDPLLAIPIAFAWFVFPAAVALGGIRGKGIRDISTHGIHYRFSPSGIAWRFAVDSGQTSGSHDWSVIKRWKETKDLFLLFAGLTVIVLPKHAFASQDAIDSLRLLFRNHIAKS